MTLDISLVLYSVSFPARVEPSDVGSINEAWSNQGVGRGSGCLALPRFEPVPVWKDF